MPRQESVKSPSQIPVTLYKLVKSNPGQIPEKRSPPRNQSYPVTFPQVVKLSSRPKSRQIEETLGALARMVLVGAPPEPLELHAFQLIPGRKTIAGVGGSWWGGGWGCGGWGWGGWGVVGVGVVRGGGWGVVGVVGVVGVWGVVWGVVGVVGWGVVAGWLGWLGGGWVVGGWRVGGWLGGNWSCYWGVVLEAQPKSSRKPPLLEETALGGSPDLGYKKQSPWLNARLGGLSSKHESVHSYPFGRQAFRKRLATSIGRVLFQRDFRLALRRWNPFLRGDAPGRLKQARCQAP